MTQRNPNTLLPHHQLVAYHVAVELLRCVQAACIRDGVLREQALRAAKSACLNCAEGAGRVSKRDRARVFAIARGEAVEATAAVEIASLTGEAELGSTLSVGRRLIALLTGLTR